MMLLQKQIEHLRKPKKVSSVFDVVGLAVNTLKVMDTFHVMHAVILAYKAMIAGRKKLVALLSRAAIIF
jgi:hypothetical protein